MYKLLREMRRRRLFRTAIIYVVAAWVVLQVAELSFQAFGINVRALRFVFIGALLGFPIAVVIGWLYDITPRGIVRTIAAPDETVDLGLQRRDYVILSALLVVVGVVLFGLIERIAEQRNFFDGPGIIDADSPGRSVAVLPFEGASAAEEDVTFLARGIHNDLLTSLSKVHDIKIISGTSVESYRDSEEPVEVIGRELHVATIMEGDVLRASDQIRVSVQLIDTASNETLWAENFDRNLSLVNIFDIQSNIASAIVTELKTTLTPVEQAQIEALPTENLDAYIAYSLGKERLAQRVLAKLEEAVQYFDEATGIDPDYAQAYVGQNDACRLLKYYGSSSKSELCPPASELLGRALSLDPTLGEAYAGLGFEHWQAGNYVQAEAEFTRAIELSPNYPQSYQWYGSMIKWSQGRHEEALTLHRKARELDPMSPVILVNLAIDELDLGHFENAMSYARRSTEVSPDFAQGYQWMADIYATVHGDPEQAIQWLTTAREIDADNFWFLSDIGLNYLDLDAAQAVELIEAGLSMGSGKLAAVCTVMVGRIYQQRLDEAATYARNCLQLAQVAGGAWRVVWESLALSVLRDRDVSAGNFGAAIDRYRSLYPELFVSANPDIRRSNFHAAVDLAAVLQRVEEHELAERILRAVQRFIDDIPRLGLNGYQIKDAEIFALLGDEERALRALRQAIDSNWRRFWWNAARYDTNLNAIRDNPQFQAIMAELAREMTARREALAQRISTEATANTLRD